MKSVVLSLLARDDWGAHQALVEGLRRWEHWDLLVWTFEALDEDLLFESPIHGPGHIERTLCHGALCAQSEPLSREDARLLLMTCAYHDIGRVNDWLDDLHGFRAAQRLPEVTTLTGEELKMVQAAIDAHSRKDSVLIDTVRSYDLKDFRRGLTIAELLKDSDGLDRVRIWDLDPKFLRRESSKQRESFAWELYRRYQAVSGGVYVPDFVQEWKHVDEWGKPV